MAKKKPPPDRDVRQAVVGDAVNTTVSNGDNQNAELTTVETVTVPVAREYLKVGKREVVRKKLRLHKSVEEITETVQVSLHRESAEVVRVPRDELVTEVRGLRQEGDTLIVPIYEEIVVVEKRLRLVEEVHITTRRSERSEVQEVLLRQESVRLEQDGEEVALQLDSYS
jgi:uncharacterized protein (TIGR02271 family)